MRPALGATGPLGSVGRRQRLARCRALAGRAADSALRTFVKAGAYHSHDVDARALFGVRDASAYVWDWRGMQLSPGRVSGLEFPIGQGSLFHLLRGEHVGQ